MKVFFRTNLGSIDAKKVSLDHKDCVAGESLEVTKEVGDSLVASGVATINADDPLVLSAQGEPDKPLKKEARASVKGETKLAEAVPAPAKHEKHDK